MWTLAVIFLVSRVSGSYGLAGVVAGVMAITAGVTNPFLARLVDRYGQSRVVLPAALAHAAGLGLLTVLVLSSAPTWTVLLAAGLLAVPRLQIGSLIRARWSHVLEDSRVRTAYAFESVVDEITFILGPILVTLLAVRFSPVAGVVTVMTWPLRGRCFSRGNAQRSLPCVRGRAQGSVAAAPAGRARSHPRIVGCRRRSRLDQRHGRRLHRGSRRPRSRRLGSRAVGFRQPGRRPLLRRRPHLGDTGAAVLGDHDGIRGRNPPPAVARQRVVARDGAPAGRNDAEPGDHHRLHRGEARGTARAAHRGTHLGERRLHPERRARHRSGRAAHRRLRGRRGVLGQCGRRNAVRVGGMGRFPWLRQQPGR